MKSQSTQPHLLYLPHPGHDKGKLVERAVGLLYSLPAWNVSVRIDGALANQDVEAQVRASTETIKNRQPFLSAQCHALKTGLPVTKKMKPMDEQEDDPTPDEQTQQEIRAGKQSVLSKAAPAAKVVLNVPKPKAATSSSNSPANTRSTATSEMDVAQDLEKQTQDRAAAKAKRQREQDEAKAATQPPSKKARGSGLKPPPKQPPGKTRKDHAARRDGASDSDQ